VLGLPATGVAPIRASEALRKKLAKLGLYNEADLLVHLPLRYEDETRITSLNRVFTGEPVQVEVVVLSNEVQYQPRRQMVVRAADDDGEITLRFFSFYPSQQAVLGVGSRIRAFGEVRGGFFGLEMVHPRFHQVTENQPLPVEMTPIYPSTAGLANSALQKLIARALVDGDLSETLPEAVRLRLKLPGLARSLHFLHKPPPDADLDTLHARNHPAWRRVKFDEVLAQQLSLRRAYLARREQGAPVLVAKDNLGARLLDSLPFGLTGAQLRAMAEIAGDLAQPYPMQRLLQGDVGAGKTIVAALAACQAISAGWQAAFMAPTEILAEQHYLKLKDWLAPLGVKVAWLSGSLKSKAKREQLAATAADAQLVIGTHALIQDGVDFARLGLAIIDEQHRFGVAQRLALRNKGNNPHQLMMSATPIPRTLAMSYYADLDVTVLDELPPGRTPIKTRLVADNRRQDVVGFVRKHVEEGRQAYWVCPLIEESEALQLQTAQDTYAAAFGRFAGVDRRIGAWAPESGRKTGGDGRLCRRRDRRAGGDDGDRSRRRCAECQPDGDRTCGAFRPVAVAPVARPGRARPVRIELRADLRRAARRNCPPAAENHFREHRRFRDRPAGFADSRPRRVCRRPAERRAAVALCRSGNGCRSGRDGARGCRGNADRTSGAGRKASAALAGGARGTAQVLIATQRRVGWLRDKSFW
jgi:ATP-dependent DNA helicase RecG